MASATIAALRIFCIVVPSNPVTIKTKAVF